MKLKTVNLLTCMLGMFSMNVFAVNEQLSDKTIVGIAAYDNFVFIYYSPIEATSQGCTEDSNGNRLYIDTTGVLGKNIVSAALAAATAGNTVTLGASGCVGDFVKGYRIHVTY